MPTTVQYSEKIDQILYGPCRGFEPRDFSLLARAALDQCSGSCDACPSRSDQQLELLREIRSSVD